MARSRCVIFFLFVFVTPVYAQVVDSLGVLRERVLVRPDDGDAWVRLGYAYLAVDSLGAAERAFQMGERYAKSARGYMGQGLVRVQKGVRHARSAFPFFRKALGVDPTLIEAQLQIARTHKLLGDQDAEGAYRKVMEMDATFAPVYLELAQWYKDNNYEVYADALRALYDGYLNLRPDDLEGYYGFALSYTEQHEYQLVLDMALVAIRKNGIDARWAALMAQAYAGRGEHDKAVALFERYLAIVDEQERVFYEDLSLVALPNDVHQYRQLTGENRKAFFNEFWRKRDPLLVSGGQARLAEHYRRVWYARTYFGKKAHPWDRRGEIYIRYGEPDYRSRSGFPNAVPSLAVENVKTKIHSEIIGQAPFGARLRDNAGRSLFSKSGLLTDPYGDVGNSNPYWSGGVGGVDVSLTGPVYPVLADPILPRREVPWESWIYTSIGGGVEFTFRDEMNNGQFEYPPVPENTLLWSYHTELALKVIAGHTPERFTLPPGMEALAFYYDVAQFRGAFGQTQTEVYFGIPPTEMVLRNGRGAFSRLMAIVDTNGEDIYRKEETRAITVGDTTQLKAGTFAPEVVSLSLAPGEYQLAVQVTDKNSGKWGAYTQELEVMTFADSLAMSDLEMAFEIATYPKDQQFKKGDVWVIPMPSRHYLRSQNPSVYYEVYNLTHNEFGQTHYRVDYTIQQDVRKGGGLFGSLGAGLKKAMTSGKPQVVVGYEREGQASWEPIYLELDIQQAKAGLNQIVVTVTDLVSGQSVSQKAIFQLSE